MMNRRLGIVLVLTCIVFISCQRKISPAADNLNKTQAYDTATFDYVFVEAVKQKILGNNGEALKLFEHCIKINPSGDAAYYQMSQIAYALGDRNNGKKFALKAFSIDQENFWYQIILAGTYYQEKNLDSAIIFYEKAAKAFPEKEDLKLMLGNVYSESNKFEKANTIFKELENKFGINKASTAASVKNMIRSGNFSEAEKLAAILTKEYPDEILFWGLMAEIYQGKGENGKAMKVYMDLIKGNPEKAEIQLALCDLLINNKKLDELFELLNTVILNEKIEKDDKISLFARLIEIPDVIKSYQSKMNISLMVLEASYKNDDIISLLRPEFLSATGELKKASERLEEIIKVKPDFYYAWEKLLLIYFEEKNFKLLEEKAEESSSKFNRSFLAKILYATAASENKHFETAIEELRKANILAGDDKELLLQVFSLRADVYYKMKDYEESFRTFDEALKLDTGDLTILNNYAYYLAEQNSRLKEAEEMAKKVIEKEGINPTFLDTYAWVLYKRGKTKEAQKIMESIIANEGKINAEYYDHYGFILKKRKDCINAVKNWNIAIKLDSTKTELLEEIIKCQGGH